MKTLNRADFDSNEAYIAALEEQNKAMREEKAKGNGIRMKVTEKGGLSVYGLGRFPVTLYKSQWLKLLSYAQAIVDFMKEHDSELSVKDAA